MLKTRENNKFRVGDIFSIPIDESDVKYFQYIANDASQLNTDVIKIFKKKYSVKSSYNLQELISGETDFYAHVILEFGTKLQYWVRVGNIPIIDETEILFRDSSDYGNPDIKISYNWWVWKINEPQRFVGTLEGENQNAEIGIVIAPDSIVCRIKTGNYDFVYPKYR